MTPRGGPRKAKPSGGKRERGKGGGAKPAGKRGGKGGAERAGGRGGRSFSGRHVATVGRRGRVTVAEPLFVPGPAVALERTRKPPAEGIALVDFKRGGARVLRELGSPDRASDVVEALLWDRLGGRGFRGALEADAAEAAEQTAAERGARRDLTGLETFTVDPASARDFDDAVSARREGDAVRIWVHIADVAAHLRPGSRLDSEARRRANSVYVPGRVEPMLPQALSSGACSLSPGEERLAVTAEIEIDAGGRPGRASFYRSLVRSDARLDYDQLDRIFAGEERPQPVVAEPLAITREVAAGLGSLRPGEALEVETAEPEFELDADGHVTGSTAVAGTEAHRLIERLMVLTNEKVAELLERRDAPTLYRVHERPDPERVAETISKLADLQVPTPPVPDPMQPAQAAELVAEASREVMAAVERDGRGRHALTSLVLRSLKQARYSEANLGHAGLGSAAYCHFTSPIRRYPDLVAHRALLDQAGEGEQAHERGTLEDTAVHCSARERDAIQIERDADDICAAFLLERELSQGAWKQEFEGEVAGLVGGGAFVSFAGELGASYEGFLPIARIGEEWFDLNAWGTALIGARSGSRVRLGDPVRFTVDRVEPVRGRVTLGPPGE